MMTESAEEMARKWREGVIKANEHVRTPQQEKDREIYPDSVYLRKGKIAGWYTPNDTPSSTEKARSFLYYHEDYVRGLIEEIQALKEDMELE